MRWTHNRHETDQFGSAWHAGHILGLPNAPDRHTIDILKAHDVVGVYIPGPKELGFIPWIIWRWRWWRWFLVGHGFQTPPQAPLRHKFDLLLIRS
jgi:hypothetical protein